MENILLKRVDWNGRCLTPVGELGQVRFASGQKGRHSITMTSYRNACLIHIVFVQEAQRPPHEKRTSWRTSRPGKQVT